MTRKTLTCLFHDCERMREEAESWKDLSMSTSLWLGARMDAQKIAARLMETARHLKTKINLELSRTEQATGGPKRYEDLVGVCCHNCAPFGAGGDMRNDL